MVEQTPYGLRLTFTAAFPFLLRRMTNMTTALAQLYAGPTPQIERADARQVRNNAGGFVFTIDCWARLDRFLVLGTEASTYYQSARELTRENASSVIACYSADPERTVSRIVEVSLAGSAPRVSPAIFALALGTLSENEDARRLAFGAVSKVCRTASHLFEFIATASHLGKGWGRGMKRCVADWYREKSVEKLAYQAVEYRSRNDMTHGRVLRTTHPRPADDDVARRALYRWMLDGSTDGPLPEIIQAHERAMASTDPSEIAAIASSANLPWEALPTHALVEPAVWQAALPSMGLTALLRNLGRLTRLGVLKPLSRETAMVATQIADVGRLSRERIHPFALLLALSAYEAGEPIAAARRGVQDGNRWEPIPEIAKALDEAFYASFRSVEPTGRRHLLALDVSGSMRSNKLMNSHLSAAQAAAAMTMMTIALEPRSHVMGFSDTFVKLPLLAGMRLDEVARKIAGLPFASTDCSLPMQYALQHGIEVDAFVVYTDNETYIGREHPHEALQRYRKTTGINAKLIVVGMTATNFSIADPRDRGMMDVVGFDSSAPALMADFLRS